MGHDFALGKDREGNIETLSNLGQELGYTVRQIEALNLDGDIVSSSRIRFLLGAGQVDQAAELLGRNYSVQGEVVVGDKRGHQLGFPTANLSVWSKRAIPAAGVYVCRAKVQGKTWGAVANIGVRPTFKSEPAAPIVEAHLLDFDEDIYGESLELEFLERVREERRFASIDALVEQIGKDVNQARAALQLDTET